jgi:trehalose 6-phosphate phosphatase
MRGILGVVSPAATLVEALTPLRSDPARAAVLLDIDGTLAPIVRHAADAHMPEATRTLLIDVGRRYRLVGCVSGRRAATARQIVSIGTLTYVGNHGGELLRPGATAPEIDPELAAWSERIRAFAHRVYTPELQRMRVRNEDKQVIAAFHWRGAPDEQAAAAALRDVAARAQSAGFVVHWGRKVLEIRPDVELDKSLGVTALLRSSADAPAFDAALYVGDDTTDIDAFRGLRTLVDDGQLGLAVCVGVSSEETPPELAREADLMIDGPSGVRALLEALLS